MERKKTVKRGRPPSGKVMKKALKKAVDIVGGVTNLAVDIDVDHAAISKWLYTRKPIPPKHVPKIVIATKGKVRPEELCPDIIWKMPEAEE
jgi:DNA-binding transcriptional regulator YdaS (Cro superfamily)